MATLFELSAQYQDFLDAVLSEAVPEEAIKDTLEGIHAPFEEKLDNYACIVKELTVMVDGIKKQEADLKKRRQQKETVIARMKEAILKAMETTRTQKVETVRNRITLAQNPPSTHILDVDLLFAAGKYIKPRKIDESIVDKTALKAAIQSGISVPGAELVPGEMGVRIK